jgi:hypothetical protein
MSRVCLGKKVEKLCNKKIYIKVSLIKLNKGHNYSNITKLR